MDHFEGATTVRLKGVHGKYLWAEPDNYEVSQQNEDKNNQAFWRVERNKAGSKSNTLRLRSCFDTYLTASEKHYHGIAFLSFSGKRVTQMRPENVESTTSFDWEPVIELGRLRLRSCFGTYLRANSQAPPWNNRVTHGLPQHENHLEWLVWEVEKVRVPNITPLELVIGPIDRVEKEQHPAAQEKSKNTGETPGMLGGETEGHPVHDRGKYPDEATARRGDDSERRPGQGRFDKQGVGMNRAADESESLDEATARRVDDSERRPGQRRLNKQGMGMNGRADESEESLNEATAGRVDDSERRPTQGRLNKQGMGMSRRADESEERLADDRAKVGRATRADKPGRHPLHEREKDVVDTTRRADEFGKNGHESTQNSGVDSLKRADESERSPVQEKARTPDVGTARRTDDIKRSSQNPGVSSVRRAHESGRHPVTETERNPVVGTTRRAEELVQNEQERPQITGVTSVRRDPESGRHPVHERQRNPIVGTTRRAEELAQNEQERPQNPDVESVRRAGGLEQRPVEERAANSDVGTARTDDLRRHLAQERSQSPVLATVGRADESQRRLAQERDRNPDVGITRTEDDPEKRPVRKRYEKYANPGVATATRAPEPEKPPPVLDTARRDQESGRRPVSETTRKTPERRPIQETFRRPQESERHPVQVRVKNSEVSTARRVQEKQSVQDKVEKLDVRTARRADESEQYPVYYPEEDRAKHFGLGTASRADGVTESHRRATSRPHR
ncbi:unnamed protein product [Calypogeia fissa]